MFSFFTNKIQTLRKSSDVLRQERIAEEISVILAKIDDFKKPQQHQNDDIQLTLDVTTVSPDDSQSDSSEHADEIFSKKRAHCNWCDEPDIQDAECTCYD